jgi:acetylornithine deacetylase
MGKMLAGDWVSTVAGWATLECRVSFVPGETGQEVMNEIQKTIANVVKDDEWLSKHPPQIEWFGWNTEPWVEPVDSLFINAFLSTSRRVLGNPPKLTGASGGLDARFGRMFGIPSLAFGPKGGNYHGIDEYVELESLLSVTKLLTLFIANWCGLADEE